MIEKTERRGRPVVGSTEAREKWELTCYEYPNKDSAAPYEARQPADRGVAHGQPHEEDKGRRT